jgi:thioesterase domain-containing protein
MEDEVQVYLYENMPLTRSMGLKVLEYRQKVRLRLPLGPNINHKSTAFGGSLSALLITAGWLEVRRNLQDLGLQGEIVIQQSSVDYLKPVAQDFEAQAEPLPSNQWYNLKAMLKKYQKGRVSVQCWVGDQKDPAATFTGQYVILLGKK